MPSPTCLRGALWAIGHDVHHVGEPCCIDSPDRAHGIDFAARNGRAQAYCHGRRCLWAVVIRFICARKPRRAPHYRFWLVPVMVPMVLGLTAVFTAWRCEAYLRGEKYRERFTVFYLWFIITRWVTPVLCFALSIFAIMRVAL